MKAVITNIEANIDKKKKNKTWTILNSYWPNRKTIKANRKELIKIMKQYKLIGFETIVFDEDNNIIAYMKSGKTRFSWD